MAGTGCIQLKTLSTDKVFAEQASIMTAYTNTFASSRIDLDAIEFVQLDDSVQVYVSGFLKAKTPTAARVVYSNVMDSLENDTIEFQSYGIFGVNDCGLSIKLPINALTSNIVPVTANGTSSAETEL
jgi:hypothetical protein